MEGPRSYKNWKEYQSDEPWQTIYEYPLFTDAHIVGDDMEGFGPYQLINAVPLQLDRPAIVLRVQDHLQNKPQPEMTSTQEEYYHGGFEADELAAILSLCMGIRLKAGGYNRVFGKDGDPKGRPVSHGYSDDPNLFYVQPKRHKLSQTTRRVLPRAVGRHILEDCNYLSSFPLLSPKEATTLVRAARMYQEAVWIAEVTPELSWLMLVSCVEVIANQWRGTDESSVERMLASRPNLANILRKYAGEEVDQLIAEVAEEIAAYMGATKTFIDFIIEFLPPEPPVRPDVFAQLSWDKAYIKKVMNKVYAYRSRALHGGHPFPAPMCEAPWTTPAMEIFSHETPFEEIPTGLATSMKGGVWLAKDTPLLLHTFEYIARNAILNWWKATAAKD